MSSIKLNKKKQPLIANFFNPSPKNRTSTAISSSSSKSIPTTTPEKIANARANSFLARANSSNGGAFDELISSDTSFESPEVNNFRNPSLARSLSSISTATNTTSFSQSIDLTRDVVDLTDDQDIPNPRSSPIASRTASSRNPSITASSSTSTNIRPVKRGHSEILNVLDGNSRKAPKRVNLASYRSSLTTSPFMDFTNTDIPLSEEQKKVIKLIVGERLNVFYTGSAGTGKSVVLKELVKRLREKYSITKVGVTASTGLAACNIGGQTLHRYLGIGIGEGTPEKLASNIKKNPTNNKRWQGIKVLIIDEISMIDGLLFEKLNILGKILRKSDQPFGGIQVICTGDFYQLPPVTKNGATPKFCFQTNAWTETIQKTVLLTEVFRQKGDTELIDMLNAVRHGDTSMISSFAKLARRVNYDDGIEPTELYPTRREVKAANDSRLRNLQTKAKVYIADDRGDVRFRDSLESLMCEKELILKEGAQVMYLRNLDDDIVNGSIGTVMYFLTLTLWEKVLALYGEDALQKDSLVIAEMKLLSSLGAKNGIKNEANPTQIYESGVVNAEWDEESRQLFEKLPRERQTRMRELCNLAVTDRKSEWLPVIKFNVRNGELRMLCVQREEFKVDLVQGRLGNSEDNVLSRSQLPLLLSWALSIHKAQGQTINRLRVNLRTVFEKGQVYVALSRATCKETLEIVNFNADKIKVADVVRDFYNKLEKM